MANSPKTVLTRNISASVSMIQLPAGASKERAMHYLRSKQEARRTARLCLERISITGTCATEVLAVASQFLAQLPRALCSGADRAHDGVAQLVLLHHPDRAFRRAAGRSHAGTQGGDIVGARPRKLDGAGEGGKGEPLRVCR